MPDPTPPRRLKVLLVPDFTQWIMGNKTRAIADVNPWIEATICSEGVIRDQLPYRAAIYDQIDLAHFTFEKSFCQVGDRFFDRMPCVVAIAHIDDWESVKHSTRADAIMYVSTEWRDELIRRGVPADRLHYLPNGTDTDIFHPISPDEKTALRKSLDIAQDAAVIGFIAKRSSDTGGRKGIKTFIDAMGLLQGRVQKIVPLIVGAGWDDAVEELESRGFFPRWFPFVPDFQSFAKIYQCMDLFWITARREGGPMTLLESMASEVCCITTPVGMARDIVRDAQNGLLTAFDDPEMLARLSLEMMNDPERRRQIGSEARRTILGGYQWKQTARAAAPLYAAAIHRFAERTGRPLRQDLLAAIDPAAVSPTNASPQPHLAAFPRQSRRAIQTAECGHWMLHLASMGATSAAIRVGMDGCSQRPFDLRGWLKVAGVVTKHMISQHHTTRPSARGNTHP